MLYQGISRFRRIALIALLVCLGLISFGMSEPLHIYFAIDISVNPVGGIIFICTQSFVDLSFAVVAMGTTILLNLFTASLITLRILYYQRFIQRTVGLPSSNPYNMVIAICLESSALIIVISFLFLAMLLLAGYYFMISMQLLVHVYVSLRIKFPSNQGKLISDT